MQEQEQIWFFQEGVREQIRWMRGVLKWNIPYLKAYDTRTLVFYLHVGFEIRWSYLELWPWSKSLWCCVGLLLLRDMKERMRKLLT
jgi:hypothetical protein